ncbi:hypothetical protein GGS20DRAFT_527711 [Poronia punctata]|nr:hypothetical protein GGS20DRAFT_527711 [Poronia punctata]
MQLTTLLLATTATVFANAAAITPRSGARLAQFRIFGAEGCHDLNGGFYLADTSDAEECKLLEADPKVVSVNLEQLYQAVAGACTVSIYTDEKCSTGKTDTAINVCKNAPDAKVWKSWKISCKS